MAQLKLDLPEDVVKEVRRRAKTRGVTVNRLVAELVRREVESGWPAGFFEEVVGGWKGQPLERPPQLPPEVRDEI
ncbi:MAG TPA: hypothetical protein VFR31_23295 [Thermoanaerobaculia bacterium]|nr:hypothetical protein [Thermoanaerobaculia bacterium]